MEICHQSWCDSPQGHEGLCIGSAARNYVNTDKSMNKFNESVGDKLDRIQVSLEAIAGTLDAIHEQLYIQARS